jgi:NAD(P)-dependent dehydrogenase (short-subunit alcohol dehydrogenase family)
VSATQAAPSIPLPQALAGRSILVIGGTSGIGAAAAGLLEQVGARVSVGSRSATGLRLDVTDEDSLRAAIDGLPELDHVLVTAGSFVAGPVAAQRPEDVRSGLLSRTEDALRVARIAAPRLPPGGSLTFTSAGGAIRPLPGTTITSASVAGLEGLVRALAVDLAPVRVNAIRPGATDTPMLRGFLPEPSDEAVATFGASLPLGRVARPDEVAAAALFLMANAYVTGTVVTVDGGGSLV